MPTETLKKINESAIQFHVKNAYECHPNLFNLSPSLRLVVVDLIYNLGYEKYKTGFPKFQTAVQRNDLWQARKESSIKGNLRRTDAHTILIDSALLCETRCMKKSALKTFDELKRLVGKRKNGCMKPSCEGAFWRTMVDCTRKDHFWYQAQKQTHFLTKTIAKIK